MTVSASAEPRLSCVGGPEVPVGRERILLGKGIRDSDHGGCGLGILFRTRRVI